MKCIYCFRDSKKSERIDGKCPNCHKSFALDPSGGSPSDVAFKTAIDRVSGQGRVRFTADNLYFELARGKFGGRPKLGCAVVAIVIATVVLAPPLGLWALGGAVVAGLGLFLYHRSQRRLLHLDRLTFETWLGLWKGTHGLPAGLIEPRAALPAPDSIAGMQSELEHYSFDRAVICDRRETVDLLLANNFHFENNCAVLSFQGYPASVFDIVRRMLKRNPKLHIFALHDATLDGCAMAHTLAHSPDWFAGQGPIFDVGLRPAHAAAFQGLWQDAEPSAASQPRPEGVSEEEYAWLSRYRLSLAAVRPEQVIKRLFRAISERKTDSVALTTTGGDSVAVSHVDTVIFSTDATSSDGGGDSFG